MLVNSAEELRAALEYSSQNGRGGDVMVEEYMQGPEVSVEIMADGGCIHVLQITDKLTTGAPHFVEMGHSQPSRLPADTQAAIRDLANGMLDALDYTDGAIRQGIIGVAASQIADELDFENLAPPSATPRSLSAPF
jgi:hypothetical protein